MKQQVLNISGIPAILWGPPSERVLIAVHGDQASKSDPCIALLAEVAVERGLRVLSFDLPEHGERQGGRSAANRQIA